MPGEAESGDRSGSAQIPVLHVLSRSTVGLRVLFAGAGSTRQSGGYGDTLR